MPVDTVSINTTNGTPLIGEHVSGDMFGANFLFMRDFHKGLNNQNPALTSNIYTQAINDLNVGSLRYPGGTVSEQLFDLVDPNSSVQTETQVMGLNSFLKYCADVNRSMTAVLPTMRFASDQTDQNGDRTEAVDSELIRTFVLALLTQALTEGVSVEAIELGNEWYVDGTLSAVEYGRIASKMAYVIDQAIDEFRENQSVGPEWSSPEVLVQVGQGGSAEKGGTAAIFAEFTAAELASVDGVIVHRYLNGVWIDGWAYEPFQTWSDLAHNAGDDREFTNYVTEWNVSSRHTTELGLRSASTLIALFSEMIEAGVDHANVWAICQNNNQNLTMSSGLPGNHERGLSMNGEAFRLLSESVQGKNLVDINGAGIASADPAATTWVEVYAGEGETVVFLSDRSGLTSQYSVDLGLLTAGYTHLWATKISVAPSEEALNPNAKPVISILSEKELLGVDGVDFQLNPWEVIRITYTFEDVGVTMKGYTLPDAMEGSHFGDRIFGRNGADTITGGGLGDIIFGGQDDDLLFGGRGEDKLFGGDGDDVLSGSDGSDLLIGSIGNDRIFGGTGSDSVFGGAGTDEMFGGSDREVDTFVFASSTESIAGRDRDTVFLFNQRQDIVDLTGMDANIDLEGDQAFLWGGKVASANGVWTFSNGKGQLLAGDTDGDAIQDFEIYFGDGAILTERCVLL